MAGGLCNLDALIPRSDFAYDLSSPPSPSDFLPLQTHDLQHGSALLLRKPDFQRETSHWSPDKVRDLVAAFSSEDLVPSVILWRSPKNEAFVIDGAHRLSSLIAWVNDDYGDGLISKAFFGDIPEHQQKAASKAREMVDELVGPFHEINDAYRNERYAKYQALATRVRHCRIYVQTLQGDTVKAEDSFFRINKQGVRTDGTELTLLYSRNCPNAIAARAINQDGTGHPHWKQFVEHKDKIMELAKEVHSMYFEPPLLSSVVKSTDVPMAGRRNSSDVLPLLLNSVNIANKIAGVVPNSRKHAEELVPPDTDGVQTVTMLKKTRRIAQRIHSEAPCSLGLNPFVYFYSLGGRHLPSSFLAMVETLADIERRDTHKQFTRIRAAFEEFLVTYSAFTPQITRKARGELRGVNAVSKYYLFCISEFQQSGASIQSVKDALLASPDYKYLQPQAYDETEYGRDFSSEVKSGVTIQHHLDTAIRCEVCKARLDYRAISHDHRVARSEEGDGSPVNRGSTHRFCNSARNSLKTYFESHGGIVPYKTETSPSQEIQITPALSSA